MQDDVCMFVRLSVCVYRNNPPCRPFVVNKDEKKSIHVKMLKYASHRLIFILQTQF